MAYAQSSPTQLKNSARPVELTVVGIGLLYALILIGSTLVLPESYQWDFRTYYYAGKAHAQGLNPYSPEDLQTIAGGNQLLKFVYPPATLAVFRPLAALPYETAYYVWLVLKLIAAGALLFIWRCYLFKDEPPIPLALFSLLSFGSTIAIDFLAGNVSLIEQALLWTGIACLLTRCPMLFAALTVAASMFKLTPIVFLLLLPAIGVRNAWRHLSAALAAFVGLLGAQYALMPVDWSRFWVAASGITEGGMQGNPSTLSFVNDVLARISSWLDSGAWQGVAIGVYALLGITILAVTFTAWQRWRYAGGQIPGGDRLVPIFLFTATYAITAPRFKSYSFILVLPAAFYVIRRIGHKPMFYALIALLLLTVHTPLPVRLPTQDVINIFWLYYPLLLAVFVWAVLVQGTRITGARVATDLSKSRPQSPDRTGRMNLQPTNRTE